MNLIGILQHKIRQTSDETNVEAIIARYLVHNITNKNLTISKIAKDCYTSNSTVSRFFKDMGYNTFQEFQIDHAYYFVDRDEVLSDWQADGKRDLLKENEFMKRQIALAIKDLTIYQDEIKFDEINHLCDLIYQKKYVHLYATHIPGNIADMLQYNFLTIGKVLEFYPLISDQINLANHLDEESLAIFISLEGSHVMTKTLTLPITESAAQTVLITQNPTMKLSQRFDEIISLGSHSRVYSGKYKLLIFAEALIHHYFVKYVTD